MSLFIFNSTKCVREVSYRIPGERRAFMTRIEAGKQAEIYSGGTKDDHAAIVEQLKPYGIVAYSEIDHSRGFIGLVYQFDHEIKPAKMLNIYKKNDEVRNEESRESRKITAAATDEMLARAAQETDIPYQGMEVKLEEEDSLDADASVSETLQVNSPKRRGRPRKAK